MKRNEVWEACLDKQNLQLEPFKNDEDPHPGCFGVHPSHKTSLILCLFSGVLSLCFGCGNSTWTTLVQQDKLRLQNYGRKYSEAGQPGQVNVQWRSDQGEETLRISPHSSFCQLNPCFSRSKHGLASSTLDFAAACSKQNEGGTYYKHHKAG